MNLKRARQHVRVRRDRFVVGYVGAKNCIWGRDRVPFEGASSEVIEPLTMKQAEARLAGMPCGACAIFELKVVKVNR